ncbi:hypothetical protein [Acinetobacter brisouii]
MKKTIIILSILVSLFVFYKIGDSYYSKYKRDQIVKEYERNDIKLRYLIFDNAAKKLKTNDLIFPCELRRGLWGTDVDVRVIQKKSEENNPKYKSFTDQLKKDISLDKDLEKFVSDEVFGVDTDIMGDLCTLIDPQSQTKISYYDKLLEKKYQILNGSLESVDISRITPDDLQEYKKAKVVENQFRMKY